MKVPRIKLAVLVAGGKSRRMGSPKALLEWEGSLLWQRQLETLAALNPEKLAVVAPETPLWLPDSISWLADAGADRVDTGPIGPMGGLLAALESARTGLIAALAVDLPQMTTEYLARLFAGCHSSKGAVPRSNSGYEPLAAIYPASAAASAREWIAGGRHDLQGWLAGLVQGGLVTPQEIDKSDYPLFRNLNTPEDLT